MIWLSSLALAAMPPGVDLDNLLAWERSADELLDGPPGCWTVEATATRKLVAFVPPDLWSSGTQYEEVVTATISGTLNNGTWTTYGVDRLDSGDPKSVNPLIRWMPTVAERLDIVPLVGTLPSTGGSTPTNLVRQIVDDWGGDISTSVAEWDAERNGVWLRREVPIRKGQRAKTSHVETFFPEGEEHATRLDVTFPTSFKAGTRFMRFRLDDAQFHIRSGPTPTAESASLMLVGLGITMGYEQRIDYVTFDPCVEAPVP
jgi:hypothetical protein